MKKFTKSEANLTNIAAEKADSVETDKASLRVKDCDYLDNLKRNEKMEMKSKSFSRQRVVSCPESDDLRSLSKGFDSTMFDLKKICEEGLSVPDFGSGGLHAPPEVAVANHC